MVTRGRTMHDLESFAQVASTIQVFLCELPLWPAATAHRGFGKSDTLCCYAA